MQRPYTVPAKIIDPSSAHESLRENLLSIYMKCYGLPVQGDNTEALYAIDNILAKQMVIATKRPLAAAHGVNVLLLLAIELQTELQTPSSAADRHAEEQLLTHYARFHGFPLRNHIDPNVILAVKQINQRLKILHTTKRSNINEDAILYGLVIDLQILSNRKHSRVGSTHQPIT
jgi:hypothetical protein